MRLTNTMRQRSREIAANHAEPASPQYPHPSVMIPQTATTRVVSPNAVVYRATREPKVRANHEGRYVLLNSSCSRPTVRPVESDFGSIA